MANVNSIINELVLRRVHIRQFLGQRRFELWADDKLQKVGHSPLEIESAVRKLLGISNEEGAAVERELERIANVS